MRLEILDEHRSYMDRYATEMIARGPTVTGDVATGSVHIVTMSDPATARAFAFDEPGYQAGVYRDVLIRRWHNVLGRTMWDFRGGREGGHRYLVLGLGSDPEATPAPAPSTEGPHRLRSAALRRRHRLDRYRSPRPCGRS